MADASVDFFGIRNDDFIFTVYIYPWKQEPCIIIIDEDLKVTHVS